MSDERSPREEPTDQGEIVERSSLRRFLGVDFSTDGGRSGGLALLVELEVEGAGDRDPV